MQNRFHLLLKFSLIVKLYSEVVQSREFSRIVKFSAYSLDYLISPISLSLSLTELRIDRLLPKGKANGSSNESVRRVNRSTMCIPIHAHLYLFQYAKERAWKVKSEKFFSRWGCTGTHLFLVGLRVTCVALITNIFHSFRLASQSETETEKTPGRLLSSISSIIEYRGRFFQNFSNSVRQQDSVN